jgi:hypothetical protein
VKTLIAVLFALCITGCTDAALTGPTAIAAVPAQQFVEGEGISCPSDKPVVTVGIKDNRVDVSWPKVGNITTYLVWLEVEEGNAFVPLDGSPATADYITDNNVVIYSTNKLDLNLTYAVQVQSACGGQLSDSVTFGGRSGAIIIPTPQPKPPSCKPSWKFVKVGKHWKWILVPCKQQKA